MSNPKDKKAICAVVISYNGFDVLPETISCVIKSVDHVIIVDNNSNDRTKEYLTKINKEKIDVIFNDKNLGIAHALNSGVKAARALGFEWVLTLDQDSKSHKDMVNEMLNVYHSLDTRVQENTAMLAPYIVYRDYDNDIQKQPTTYQEKDVVITSGNLIKTAIWAHIGGYNNELFIDAVDFDFCLRLRNKGYKILMCKNAYLFHSLGEKKQIDLILFKFTIHSHNCVRKYYMARNHLYIIKNYFCRNFVFCCKKSIFFIILIIQSLLFENDKLKSLKCFYLGIKDGINNKLNENRHNI